MIYEYLYSLIKLLLYIIEVLDNAHFIFQLKFPLESLPPKVNK